MGGVAQTSPVARNFRARRRDGTLSGGHVFQRDGKPLQGTRARLPGTVYGSRPLSDGLPVYPSDDKAGGPQRGRGAGAGSQNHIPSKKILA